MGERRPERGCQSAREQQNHIEKLGLQIPSQLFLSLCVAVVLGKHAQGVIFHRKEVEL